MGKENGTKIKENGKMEVEYLKYSSGVAVREYVEQMVKMSTGMAKAAYEYILRNGEYFEGALSITAIPRTTLVGVLVKPRKKWCFYNAQMLTLLHPIRNIEYYEGVGDNGIFIGAHAWNLYEGKVVDITWEDIPKEFKDLEGVKPLQDFQYFGVKLPHDFVRKHNPIGALTVQPLLFRYLEELH